MKWICYKCFPEKGVKKYIFQNGEGKNCFRCTNNEVSLPIIKVAEYIQNCLYRSYTNDPYEYLVFDPEIGAFLGETIDKFDLLEEEIFSGCDEFSYDDPIFSELFKEIEGDEWCRHSPFEDSYSWEEFSSYIKHHRRFFFLNDHRFVEEPTMNGSPQTLLNEVVTVCYPHLIEVIPAGTLIYRSRYTPEDQSFLKFEELISPPPELCKMSQRINPPGISHFYGAFDEKTALEETREKGGKKYTIGIFELKGPLKVINFTKVPSYNIEYTIFEPDEEIKKQKLIMIFLREFVNFLTRPITRDDKINIEYVPTQIVCEFIRAERTDIKGIIYPSACYSKGRNICIFEYENLKNILNLKGIKVKSLHGSIKMEKS
jgi:hypothetical protein